jgi:hypothetical protein
MEEDGKVTVKLKKFGKFLVTRQDAKDVLQSIGVQGHMPVLDFAGVKVANHPFADELGKGLAMCFDLSKIKLTGANEYVRNCLEAGFSTATY